MTSLIDYFSYKVLYLELLLHFAADLELADSVLLSAAVPLVHDSEGVLAAAPTDNSFKKLN
jgi:hypothetical protein